MRPVSFYLTGIYSVNKLPLTKRYWCGVTCELWCVRCGLCGVACAVSRVRCGVCHVACVVLRMSCSVRCGMIDVCGVAWCARRCWRACVRGVCGVVSTASLRTICWLNILFNFFFRKKRNQTSTTLSHLHHLPWRWVKNVWFLCFEKYF